MSMTYKVAAGQSVFDSRTGAYLGAGAEVDLSHRAAHEIDALMRRRVIVAAGEIEATDAAKELAAAEGVDLALVAGTGKDGQIIKGDVAAAQARRAADEAEAIPPASPLTGAATGTEA